MTKRIAVLLDETGKEIFRGSPADLPVRFVDDAGETVEWTMNSAVDAGTPIDEESGDDLTIMPEDA